MIAIAIAKTSSLKTTRNRKLASGLNDNPGECAPKVEGLTSALKEENIEEKDTRVEVSHLVQLCWPSQSRHLRDESTPIPKISEPTYRDKGCGASEVKRTGYASSERLCEIVLTSALGQSFGIGAPVPDASLLSQRNIENVNGAHRRGKAERKERKRFCSRGRIEANRHNFQIRCTDRLRSWSRLRSRTSRATNRLGRARSRSRSSLVEGTRARRGTR